MDRDIFTKKRIWKLTIPLIIEQLLTQLMGTADTMMVSCAGSAAISAVSLVDSINVLIQQVFIAMATGGGIICAQYLGRGERVQASKAARQLVLTVVALSTAVMAALILLYKPILRLIFGQVDAQVMESAQIYLLITAFSYPFIALYNAGASLFRVDGNSRLPLLVSTASNLLNIAGNAILIFGFQAGAAGAAIATLVSRIFCAVVVMLCLRRPKQGIEVRGYRQIRPDGGMIRNILRVGIPTGVENGMFQFGKLAIQSSVSTLSTAAIAAQAMTASVELVTGYTQIGIGLAMMTVVGQCIGANRVEEAKRHIRVMTGYAELLTIVICALAMLSIRTVTRLAGMEPAAAEMTHSMTGWITIAKPLLWTLSFIPAYGMRAAGDVRFSMIVSSASMWIFRVVTTTLLIRVFHFGPIAVWIGMFSDWAVRSVVYTLRFRSGKWTRQQVIGE